MLTRMINQHLDDAALAEIWTNAVADGKAPSHPHFEACAECRLRLSSFTAWLDDVRDVATAEADAAFPQEKLVAQQNQILRRLEVSDQPTRIIAFPRTPAGDFRPSPMRRWVAAAGLVAAGLVAGVGLGQLMDLRHMSEGPGFPADRQQVESRMPNVIPVSFTDDAILAELEAAAAPRYEALQAYDTFTPRVADLIVAR